MVMIIGIIFLLFKDVYDYCERGVKEEKEEERVQYFIFIFVPWYFVLDPWFLVPISANTAKVDKKSHLNPDRTKLITHSPGQTACFRKDKGRLGGEGCLGKDRKIESKRDFDRYLVSIYLISSKPEACVLNNYSMLDHKVPYEPHDFYNHKHILNKENFDERTRQKKTKVKIGTRLLKDIILSIYKDMNMIYNDASKTAAKQGLIPCALPQE
ncbi:hypothetical protein F4703DRAFT_1799602 [Phycomyces blakesleeanus]